MRNSKKLEDFSDDELSSLAFSIHIERRNRLIEDLKNLASEYVNLHGNKEGIETMGEDLCRIVAPKKYPEGWGGLVNHLIKISG